MISAHLSLLPPAKQLATKTSTYSAAGAVPVTQLKKTCDLVILPLKASFSDTVNLRGFYAFLSSFARKQLMPSLSSVALNKAALLLPWKPPYGSSPCHTELAVISGRPLRDFCQSQPVMNASPIWWGTFWFNGGYERQVETSDGIVDVERALWSIPKFLELCRYAVIKECAQP